MVKHGLVVSDLHCGHLVGLTPPRWQIRQPKGTLTKREKWYAISRALWDTFETELSKLPPLDFVFELGDLIDGKAKKSGGSELLTSCVQEQCAMAAATFNDYIWPRCKRKAKIIGVYGTDYHVSTEGEDWENEIAKDAGFYKIGAHEWPEVNGCVFDLKHHIGSSSIPHGRFTAVSRDQLWNTLWAERGEQPKARVVFRGHVHSYRACDTADATAMTCPALQGMGSRYGSRRCSGTVDWGFIHVWVETDGTFHWKPIIRRVISQKPTTIEV